MKTTRNGLILIVITTFLIGIGAFWILEDPYVKSQYYETDAMMTVELQWPADAEYGEIQSKLVYNRPFAFVLKHKPKDEGWSWSWTRIYVHTDWRTGEPMYPNSTFVRFSNVERPATLIVWVRYYKDIVEDYNDIKLERTIIIDTVKYECSITPMSK